MKKKKGAGARRAVCGVVRPRVLDRRHLIALRLALRVAGMGTIDLMIWRFVPLTRGLKKERRICG